MLTDVEKLPQTEAEILDEELEGIDALDQPLTVERGNILGRIWSAFWPKVMAIAIVLLGWQILVWTEWRPIYVLPQPSQVWDTLTGLVVTADFWKAIAITLQRGALGYSIAIVIGTLLGLAVSQSTIMRRAFGSLIMGLQSMPSIAWFPFAILAFKLSEAAILFVVVLGAAPSIANGLVSGVDQIPPLYRRAGKVLGARGFGTVRHVILPATVPNYIAGLKQGWAFAWRSLMAGELLVIIASKPSIGVRLSFSRELADAPLLIAWMIVVLVIGITVDASFGALERNVLRRRGLMRITN